MKNKTLCGVTALLLASAGLSHASFTGTNTSPLGDRSTADIKFAGWDTFPSITFTNIASQIGNLGVTLSQSVAGTTPGYGPLPAAVPNDLFYTASSASSWTITGSSTTAIETIALQIKMTPPGVGSDAGFVTPTLTGVGGATSVLTTTGVTSGNDLVQWTWSDLSLPANESFTIDFANLAGEYHVAIDAISIDTSAVPEPSAYGLAAGLLLGLVIWRRRQVLRRVSA